VLAVREDKPVCTLATTVTNQDGVVVLDGTAVVWRDPVVRAAAERTAPSAGIAHPDGPGAGEPDHR
jgi:hypothetical protein